MAKKFRTIYVVDCVPYLYLSEVMVKFGLDHLYSYISRHGWDGDEVTYRGVVIRRHMVATK